MRIKVSKLTKPQEFPKSIKEEPGCYVWWFSENWAPGRLKELLAEVDSNQIRKIKINGETYLALYFGISKDIKKRINWHISQKHSPSAVKSGYLSTLRQTICAILNKNMSSAEKVVNDTMQDNCYLELDYTDDYATAQKNETKELATNCYLLNIKSNKCAPKEVIQKIKKWRKDSKR